MKNTTRITLSSLAQRQLAQDIHQRAQIEACGVLLGSIDATGNWHVTRIQPLQNIFNSPVYFEFSPEELLTTELQYPGEIIGVYHSHPTGFARASSTDRENMQRVNQEEQIPWIWLIVRGPFDAAADDQQTIPLSSIIAYHHYEREGLQIIQVESGA